MMTSLTQLVSILCFVGGQAAFDCALYNTTCSGTSNYQAYKDCAATVEANGAGMSCRETHLGLAAQANGATAHCPHARPIAQAPCDNEHLKTFNCTLYASTCSGVANYQAYSNCASTVAVNDANHMACRINHLDKAAQAGGAATHCPHAAPAATGPCAGEALKPFECSLYASTCSSVSGYEVYANCADTIAVNGPNGMACRTQHLALAAASGGAAVHCPHAKFKQDSPLPCAPQALKSFDCTLYSTTCSGIAGYQAYSGCDSTIAMNDGNHMACRIHHLHKASFGSTDQLRTTHCPHAAPVATGPCATEALKPFDCALYVSTCSSISGYEVYSDCANTIAANGPNGMACRTQHLAAAAASGGATVHCPHAKFNAEAPCASQTLKTFDCAVYASTCSGTTGYQAYVNCPGVVAANPGGMQCRINHLGKAAMAGGAATHCPHAAPTAAGPCANEALNPAVTTTVAAVVTTVSPASAGFVMRAPTFPLIAVIVLAFPNAHLA